MRTSYKTKQREILIDYLKSASGSHITVNEACDYFASRGMQIGKTTVYRHLERMVDEGIVNKYIIDSQSPACFEYMTQEDHSAQTCFHCKCEKCGKLIHLHCEELDAIASHLINHHAFQLNPLRTVFYGVCDDCLRGDAG